MVGRNETASLDAVDVAHFGGGEGNNWFVAIGWTERAYEVGGGTGMYQMNDFTCVRSPRSIYLWSRCFHGKTPAGGETRDSERWWVRISYVATSGSIMLNDETFAVRYAYGQIGAGEAMAKWSMGRLRGPNVLTQDWNLAVRGANGRLATWVEADIGLDRELLQKRYGCGMDQPRPREP